MWRHDGKPGQHRGDYHRHPGSTATGPVDEDGGYAQIWSRVDVVMCPVGCFIHIHAAALRVLLELVTESIYGHIPTGTGAVFYIS